MKTCAVNLIHINLIEFPFHQIPSRFTAPPTDDTLPAAGRQVSPKTIRDIWNRRTWAHATASVDPSAWAAADDEPDDDMPLEGGMPGPGRARDFVDRPARGSDPSHEVRWAWAEWACHGAYVCMWSVCRCVKYAGVSRWVSVSVQVCVGG
jgi:hypothetical protein